MYLKNTCGLCTKGQVITLDFWSPLVGDFAQSNMESLHVNQIRYISSEPFTAKTFYCQKISRFTSKVSQENDFRKCFENDLRIPQIPGNRG